MILSDSSIKSRIQSGDIIFEHLPGTPEFNALEQIGPASIDFRLGNSFKSYKRDKTVLIDPHDDQKWHFDTTIVWRDEYFVLHPGQFVLGVTMEKIRIPYDLVARCEWRSSLWRLGLIIHSTAGFVDPGFEGTITLEMTNINEVPIKLYPGMKIGQYAFETLEGQVEMPYDQRPTSKYMGQIEVQESKLYKDN